MGHATRSHGEAAFAYAAHPAQNTSDAARLENYLLISQEWLIIAGRVCGQSIFGARHTALMPRNAARVRAL